MPARLQRSYPPSAANHAIAAVALYSLGIGRWRTGAELSLKALPTPDLALIKQAKQGRAIAGGLPRAGLAVPPTGCRAGTMMGLVAPRWSALARRCGKPRGAFHVRCSERRFESGCQPPGEERLPVNLLQKREARARSGLREFVG